MSGALIIGPDEQKAITEAIAKARVNPTPWEVMKTFAKGDYRPELTLKERGDTSFMKVYPAQKVILGTYQCYFSFEVQPAGLMRHLSVSSGKKGKVPGLEVMKMVAQEFGFSDCPPQRPGRVWTEEFQRGWHAVNVAELEPS